MKPPDKSNASDHSRRTRWTHSKIGRTNSPRGKSRNELRCDSIEGCGFGLEVIELASRAFDVTAIDFAKSAIQALTKQLDEQGLRADVIQESVLNYVAKEPIDAILSLSTRY
ncbi:MAG: class I SAM-dependent methyltransferase [Aureliella sp.]